MRVMAHTEVVAWNPSAGDTDELAKKIRTGVFDWLAGPAIQLLPASVPEEIVAAYANWADFNVITT